uniref:Uncharacterized protein n=1 Tax=Pyrodinium bahamense TaxID=73915 RepID=A0A7R9ZX82_9DINO
MAAAMDISLNAGVDRRDRPGEPLPLPRMAELGVSFERQPDGSDSCAVHSLNNLTQPILPPEQAADISAARVAAAVAAERGERVELEGWEMQSLFKLKDLQQAESECRLEECNDSFLPAAVSSLMSLRMDSSLDDGRSPKARTGMFEVEAVKAAARAKGFEVIDVEPTPCWEELDCGAARYAQAARDLEAKGCERWFLGYLVYERIPGRAMHYYTILRRGAGCMAGKEQEAWLLLDGLDRGPKSPRNRLMSYEDMIAFYNRNADWFKSWLVRWYPVVDRRAAVTTVCRAVARGVRDACGEREIASALLGISPQRAEAALDTPEIRWDVARAATSLLQAVTLVDRELQVLQLAVSEKRARTDLEQTGWDFEQAVKSHAERILKQCNSEGAGSQFGGVFEKYSALHLGDWDPRAAAQVLLLVVQADDHTEGTDPVQKLKAGASALEACAWDADQALAVLHLLRARRNTEVSEGLTEAYAARLLKVGGDLSTAERLLQVHERFPQTPPGVCAEALRRADGHPPSACEMLKEFQGRVQETVARAWRLPEGDAPEVEGAEEVACLALELAEWNPHVAFITAESFALASVHVRRELRDLEAKARLEATAIVHWGDGPAPQRSSGSRAPPAAQAACKPTEADLATALGTLDALDGLRARPVAVAEIVGALQRAEMDTGAAARSLWHARTGLSADVPSDKAPSGAAPEQPQAKAAMPKPQPESVDGRSSKVAAVPCTQRRKKGPDKSECIMM